MKTEYTDEYHPSVDEPATQEPRYAPKETATGTETEFLSPTEYRVPSVGHDAASDARQPEKTDRHRLLKRMILAPVVSAVAVISVVFSSFHYDPLANVSPSTSVTETAPSMDSESRPNPDIGGEPEDDSFPLLPNLNPDFEGNYAWSDLGSEEYIMLIPSAGEVPVFLVMGSAIAQGGTFNDEGELVPNRLSTHPNAEYDKASNTLTLQNLSASYLEVNLMGNGFTIRLIGENHLDELSVWGASYGGSVTLTGSGSLTVNENGNAKDGIGIYLHCEGSKSCLMIDRDVTLDAYGDTAVWIEGTLTDQAIYYRKSLRMTGGQCAVVGKTVGTDGVTYYNYSIVDESGKPSTHVRFAPDF